MDFLISGCLDLGGSLDLGRSFWIVEEILDFVDHQENLLHVVGLMHLMCLTVVVSELLPFHFFITNFKESEFFQSFISVIHTFRI